MINVKQAYVIAKSKNKELQLVSVLNFGDDFGFLFGKGKNDIVIGSAYILINKNNKSLSLLPTTPNNLLKIQSAKSIPLTTIL